MKNNNLQRLTCHFAEGAKPQPRKRKCVINQSLKTAKSCANSATTLPKLLDKIVNIMQLNGIESSAVPVLC